MTYLVLDVIFVGVAGVVLLVARRAAALGAQRQGAQRQGPQRQGTQRRTRPSGVAIAWTIVVLAVMTAVFDNLMIAAGLFEFSDEHLIGLFVGRAPVEDVGYPLAAALLLPALWHLLGARGTTRARVAPNGGRVSDGDTTDGDTTDGAARTPGRAS